MLNATADDFMPGYWSSNTTTNINRISKKEVKIVPIISKAKEDSIDIYAESVKKNKLKQTDEVTRLYNWKNVNTLVVETYSDAEVIPMNVSRLFAINFAMVIICLFVVIATVSGLSLLYANVGVGGKVVSFTGLFGGILSVLFIWYNVFYEGFKGQ